MLTEAEAFKAMREFLLGFWERGGSSPDSEVAELLSWTGSDAWADGGTSDPAQWHDWLAAVRKVKPPAALMRAGVLLSMHRALWQMVTPDLRAVAVGWTETEIKARLLYDASAVTDKAEIVSLIETYVIGDFEPSVQTDVVAEPRPAPESLDLRPGEEWVYMRMEDPELYD